MEESKNIEESKKVGRPRKIKEVEKIVEPVKVEEVEIKPEPVLEVKTEVEKIVESPSSSPPPTPEELVRIKAWDFFCENMKRREPEKYARMKAAGELDKIPKEFIIIT